MGMRPHAELGSSSNVKLFFARLRPSSDQVAGMFFMLAGAVAAGLACLIILIGSGAAAVLFGGIVGAFALALLGLSALFMLTKRDPDDLSAVDHRAFRPVWQD